MYIGEYTGLKDRILIVKQAAEKRGHDQVWMRVTQEERQALLRSELLCTFEWVKRDVPGCFDFPTVYGVSLVT